jgi:hypothetical protein
MLVDEEDAHQAEYEDDDVEGDEDVGYSSVLELELRRIQCEFVVQVDEALRDENERQQAHERSEHLQPIIGVEGELNEMHKGLERARSQRQLLVRNAFHVLE